MARVVIPFTSGQRGDVDPKMMPDGGLRRVENMRMRRDGRLGLRFGYTAIANTTPNALGVVPFDLIGWNGRLCALGCKASLTNQTPNDLYEYVDQAQFKWRPTDNEEDGRLCPVTGVRDVGRMPAQSASIAICDVSAGGGLVCMVWQPSATRVHIFDPDTDATILVADIASMTAARTVCTGSIFYIIGIVGTKVELWSFNPATDRDLVQLTDAFSTGDAILRMDATVSEAGTTFIVGLARSTPTVSLKLFDVNGTATQTITGPAVTLTRLTVFRQATRVHLLAQEADEQVDLYTYLISGGSLENTSLGLASASTSSRQPGMCVAGQGSTNLLVTFEEGSNRTIRMLSIAPSTHTVVNNAAWYRVRLNSKPANGSNVEVFGACFSENASRDSNAVGVAGIVQINAPEMLACATDKSLARNANQHHLPHIAKDTSTGKYYWIKLVADADLRSNPVVSELLVNDTGRRQTAAIDSQLYIAAGATQIFGGRQLVEAGFLNRPVILSATPSAAAGSITSGALYAIAVTFEWFDEQGRFHTSELSDVREVTMGAGENTITLSVTGPLSLRCNATNQAYGSACKVVAWRSLAAPDKQLLRDNTATVTPGFFGQEVSIVLTQSDTSLEDEAVIYTQGSSGARSGPNPFVSPLPCRYIWPSADKLATAGTPNDAQLQESRAAFPNEPITWAQNLGGIGSAPERILAVARLDERRIVWTATGLFEFTGDGLDINGVGDIGFPRRLPSPGGLHGGVDGWKSIVETSIGIFFQLASDKIYLVPRGGGAPIWIGKPARDTLVDFPIITSATYVKRDQTVCFTCNNSLSTDAVILTYDIEAQLWTTDTELTEITSSCEYDGRLATLREGVVYLQNTTHPADAFIAMLVESGTIYPFGQGGQGQIDEIQWFGEFRGACTLTPSLSFDDGASYTALTAKSLTGLTVGSTVTLKWGPQRMRGDRVRIKFETSSLSGATEQVVFNFATIDFRAANRTALRNATEKG